jgi:hypothetical protein
MVLPSNSLDHEQVWPPPRAHPLLYHRPHHSLLPLSQTPINVTSETPGLPAPSEPASCHLVWPQLGLPLRTTEPPA